MKKFPSFETWHLVCRNSYHFYAFETKFLFCEIGINVTVFFCCVRNVEYLFFVGLPENFEGMYGWNLYEWRSSFTLVPPASFIRLINEILSKGPFTEDFRGIFFVHSCQPWVPTQLFAYFSIESSFLSKYLNYFVLNSRPS